MSWHCPGHLWAKRGNPNCNGRTRTTGRQKAAKECGGEAQLLSFLHDHICQGVTSCVHERGRNQISPFWTQVMFSVFRGPKYDDIRPNHTKKYQKISFRGTF